MPKFIVLLVSLLISSAHAGDYSTYRFHCVVIKDGKFDYKIDKVESYNTSLYTPVNLFDEGLSYVVTGAIRRTSRVVDEARNILSVIQRGELTKGKSTRSMVIRSIKEQIRKHDLNKFEQASLINCAVSSLVEYKQNLSTKFGSVLEIYEKGQGICTEMAAVAQDLGAEVGLKVRSMDSNAHHTWPEYSIEGKWYILDPTSSGSSFMESLKQ